MHSQATSEGTADAHGLQQPPHDWPAFAFGGASHDPAKKDQISWLPSARFGNAGDDMNQQFKTTTGDSTKWEEVYDKQSQKCFVNSLTPFVSMFMEGSITKESFVARVETCCDQELGSKGISDHTSVQLPALKKRKSDQALPPGPRLVTHVKFRAHLVAAAMSRLKEAQRKVNKNKV